MAAIIESTGRSRVKKGSTHSLKVDMTPMVDLGFLLITFFIFTTTLSTPVVASLVMPKEEGAPTPVAASKVMTVLLGPDDRVYAYEGQWERAVAEGKVISTNLAVENGVGKLIRAKQHAMDALGLKDHFQLVIKPLDGSTYGNFIDMIDETKINGVERFVIVAPEEGETLYVSDLKIGSPGNSNQK
jgi:biopolymer transport protein ExbD